MNLLILISNIIQGCVWLFCGLLLLLIKSSPHLYSRPYRIAKRYLAFVCLTASVAFAVSLTFGELSSERIEIFGIYNIISFYILNIFGFYSFVNLLCYKKPSKQNLFATLIPFSCLAVAYCMMAILYGETKVYSISEYIAMLIKSPTLIIKTFMFITVGIQFAINCKTYLKTDKERVAILNNYFSDSASIMPRWIKNLGYVTKIFGTVVFVSIMIPNELYDLIYSIILTSGAIYYTIKYINYQNYFLSALPAVEFAETLQVQDETPDAPDDSCVAEPNKTPEELISAWVNLPDKPFLKSGITLDEVSQVVKIPQRKLSKYINGEYGMNFNSWINQLKIAEVKRELENRDKNTTLTEIAFRCGFVDLASMSNAFKKITGVPPSAFKTNKTID